MKNLRGICIEARNEEEVEVRKRLEERDKVQCEIQQLAIRMQRNGGVDIADRRVGRYVVKACFVASELVQWIMKTYGTTEHLAVLICEEMWTRGLISHGTQRFKPFENSRNLFFRVAHPYTVNLLVAPSDLNLLHRQLRDNSGPKLKDRIAYGKLIKHCFVASELVDWCVSVRNVYPRERAIQIAQQLLDEGYIYNVNGSARFLDSAHALCQHKDTYCGNINLRGRLLEHFVNRFSREYERQKDARKVAHLSVGESVTIIKDLVQDCHDIKARYLLDRLLEKKRIEVIPRAGSAIPAGLFAPSKQPIVERTTASSAFSRSARTLNVYDIDNALDDNQSIVKLRPFDPSQSSNVFPTGSIGGFGSLTYGFGGNHSQNYDPVVYDPNRPIDVVGNISQREAQRRALRLLAQLSGAAARLSHAPMTPLSRGLKLLSKFVHVFMAIALVLEVSLGVTSTLDLTSGIQDTFTQSQFDHLSTISDFARWLEDSMLAPGFPWLGRHFALVDYPTLLVSVPEAVDCTADAVSERNFRARAASIAGFQGENLTQIDSIPCFRDSRATTSGLAHIDNFSSRRTMLWQANNYTGSASQMANANVFQEMGEQPDHLQPSRLALQLVILSAQTKPPTVTVIRALAHMGPVRNEVVVRTSAIELEHQHWATGLLWIAWSLCVIEYVVAAWYTHGRYMRSLRSASMMSRVVLSLVGLVLHAEHTARQREYLEGVVESGNAWHARSQEESQYAHDPFEYLFDAGNASHTCLVAAMFFTCVGLMAKLGGARYDIFAVIMRTLGGVSREVEIIVLSFLGNFVAFSMSAYAIMQSSAPEFKSPTMAAMTFFGSMFGGAPWKSFHASAVPSLLTGTTGFLLLGFYLFFSIFVLLSLFQALMLESFQHQKKQEYALNNELKRHMYTDEAASELETLKEWLTRSPDASSRANGPLVRSSATDKEILHSMRRVPLATSGSDSLYTMKRAGQWMPEMMGESDEVAKAYSFDELAAETRLLRASEGPKRNRLVPTKIVPEADLEFRRDSALVSGSRMVLVKDNE